MSVRKGGVPPLDLAGQKYNRLRVTIRAPHKGRHAYWHCVCECGTKTVVKQSHLRDGRTKSCGCLSREQASAAFMTHGETRKGMPTTEYQIWCCMKERCLNPRNPAYQNYGGRGIAVCDRWLASIEHFISDMGRRPSDSHSLDRKNNDGNYEPGNCRWATSVEQARNKRSNKKELFEGEYLCLSEIAIRIGMKPRILHNRIRKGWPFERATSEAVRPWPQSKSQVTP